MLGLYGAIDAGGKERFIDEVERGLACGCFCPICGSALVAKQGSELEWHFAHVSGQEAPECRAGAANILRRLAIGHLRSALTALPAYERQVRGRSSWGERSLNVRWQPEALAMRWADSPAQDAAVALIQLREGSEAELFVRVGEAPYGAAAPVDHAVGSLTFWVDLPGLATLRNRQDALAHIAAAGRLRWDHLPDAQGLIAAAVEKVRALVEDDERQAKAHARRQAEEAGRRWAQIARTGRFQPRQEGWIPPPMEREGIAEPRPARDSAAPADHPWAPGRKPASAFVFYRLRDGTAWVLYTLVDGRCGIAPRPAQEGWDEALPPSVGRVDAERGIYVAPDSLPAMLFFRDLATTVRTSSNPADFDGL